MPTPGWHPPSPGQGGGGEPGTSCPSHSSKRTLNPQPSPRGLHIGRGAGGTQAGGGSAAGSARRPRARTRRCILPAGVASGGGAAAPRRPTPLCRPQAPQEGPGPARPPDSVVLTQLRRQGQRSEKALGSRSGASPRDQREASAAGPGEQEGPPWLAALPASCRHHRRVPGGQGPRPGPGVAALLGLTQPQSHTHGTPPRERPGRRRKGSHLPLIVSGGGCEEGRERGERGGERRGGGRSGDGLRDSGSTWPRGGQRQGSWGPQIRCRCPGGLQVLGVSGPQCPSSTPARGCPPRSTPLGSSPPVGNPFHLWLITRQGPFFTLRNPSLHLVPLNPCSSSGLIQPLPSTLAPQIHPPGQGQGQRGKDSMRPPSLLIAPRGLPHPLSGSEPWGSHTSCLNSGHSPPIRTAANLTILTFPDALLPPLPSCGITSTLKPSLLPAP